MRKMRERRWEEERVSCRRERGMKTENEVRIRQKTEESENGKRRDRLREWEQMRQMTCSRNMPRNFGDKNQLIGLTTSENTSLHDFWGSFDLDLRKQCLFSSAVLVCRVWRARWYFLLLIWHGCFCDMVAKGIQIKHITRAIKCKFPQQEH